MRAPPASSGVPPGPASPLVGAEATAVGPSVGVASSVGDGLAEADPVGEADGLGVAVADPDGAVLGRAPGVAGVVPAVVDPVVARGAVVVLRGVAAGFGAAVVVRGVDVVFGVDTVAVGAGGAMRGCWPDPKRQPWTVPGWGS
jgi:hypothetical protein